MLFELYKANVAKAPKNQQHGNLRQTSPTSAETHESSTIAAIATNGAGTAKSAAANDADIETTSKNLHGDEMMPQQQHQQQYDEETTKGGAASFHPGIKYTKTNSNTAATNTPDGHTQNTATTPPLTAIPTSVLVPTSPQLDVKPIVQPPGGLVFPPDQHSVIKQVPAAVPPPPPPTANVAGAIAVALLRDGYHSFQQQLRAQEILKQQMSKVPSAVAGGPASSSANPTPTKILETFLRQHRESQQQGSDNGGDLSGVAAGHDAGASDTNDGDDEDDSRYNGFDDIHLVESGAAVGVGPVKGAGFSTGSLPNLFHAANVSAGEESSKYMITPSGGAFRPFEYSMSDYGGNTSNGNGGGGSMGSAPGGTNGSGQQNANDDMEPVYMCRHCGKKYRWKSTLRRHENVECGGKEPSHQCPYCPYRSKQRGNLGVHVRKHHSNLPQLASKRRSKYSMKMEDQHSASSTNGGNSDDSQSRLIIDCSK